jgi:tetratricopeptide (TPR) repeat protein
MPFSFLPCVLSGWLIAAQALGDPVANPSIAPPTPANRAAAQSGEWKQLLAATQTAIDTKDPAQIAQAIASLREQSEQLPSREQALRFLLKNKRYDDVEQMAVDLICDDPSTGQFVAIAEKLRAEAFLAQKKGPEALSAARSFYDTAQFGQSVDAINFVTQCLALCRPEDPSAAMRFKRQQIAWASVALTSQPATAQPATAQPGDPATQPAGDLGAPVLPTIPPDAKPFEQAAQEIDLTDYHSFPRKANLLLLTGRAAEARQLLERAQAIAPENEQAHAIENVARAIRAEAGCVAPANAYILKMRAEQQAQQ